MAHVLRHSLVLALAGGFALAGCGDLTQAAPDGTGSLELALTLPDGTRLERIDYLLSGALLQPSRSGSVRVEGAGDTARLRLGALPLGSGYALTLAGRTTAGADCVGSAQFSLSSVGTTELPVTMTCGGGTTQDQDTVGDIVANVTTVRGGTVCPSVTGIDALPAAAAIGGRIVLEARLTSVDPTLEVMWTGEAGVFSSPNALTTEFTCQGNGTIYVGVRVKTLFCPEQSSSLPLDCGDPSLGPLCVAEFPCLSRTRFCVDATHYREARDESCSSFCGSNPCTGVGCAPFGPVIACPSGTVCTSNPPTFGECVPG